MKKKRKSHLIQNVNNLPEVIKEVSITSAGRMIDRISSALHRIPYRLNISRQDKVLMFEIIDSDSGYLSFPYWSLIISSCGIATLGLITNSPAVIIGAMLVSPLMAPITGLGLGIALNDMYMGIRSLVTIFLSVIISVLTSAFITIITTAQEASPEIIARTNPTLLDLFIALFCGIVAGFSTVRSKGKVVLGSAAPGAAIGVALMPPLCVVGFGLGFPVNFQMMWGGFLLFLTNLFAIILTTSLFYFFVYKRIDISRLLAEAKTERKQEHLFSFLYSFSFYKRLNSMPASRKRFLFPAILILLISYPLATSLIFLRDKESIRIFISQYFNRIEGMNILAGAERLRFTRDSINGSIIFSGRKGNVAELEKTLNENIQNKFTNFNSRITLIRVAGESDLQEIKPMKITFDTDQNIMHDALRDKHASELVKRAFDLLMIRFPDEVGIMTDVKIIFTTNGMESIVVEYAGKKISDEAKNILVAALKNDLLALKGEFLNLEIKKISDLSNKHGCRRNSSPEESLRKLDDVFSILDENEFLYVTLQLNEKIHEESMKKIISKKMQKRIILEDPIPGCLLGFTFRK